MTLDDAINHTSPTQLLITAIIMCTTLYVAARIAVWALGWMFRTVGAGIEVDFALSADEEIGELPRRTPRHDWDSHNADAVRLTHEKLGDEEPDEVAADFVLWKFEVDEEPAIRLLSAAIEEAP